mgnify:CR=1 FL=1
MGLWGSLVSLRGLGLRDPGSNPGSPISLYIKMKNIVYYTRRLEFIIQLFREHNLDLLLDNQDKIKSLVRGYKKFIEYKDYTPSLVSTIETFIL